MSDSVITPPAAHHTTPPHIANAKPRLAIRELPA
jgi:hypothetical protein